jgi:hypothetical protein
MGNELASVAQYRRALLNVSSIGYGLHRNRVGLCMVWAYCHCHCLFAYMWCYSLLLLVYTCNSTTLPCIRAFMAITGYPNPIGLWAT